MIADWHAYVKTTSATVGKAVPMNPPTISAALVSFFRAILLSHAPQRHAVMQRPGAHQKYLEVAAPITDAQLQQHLAGKITLAAPAAHADLGCVLPLDVDQGGLPAIEALLQAATATGLWAFGQYTPRRDWTPQRQRGYVWVAVDGLVNVERLALLGQQLVRDAGLPAHHVEIRAHHAVTRLPLGRHTHTRRFGQLLLPSGVQLDIDADPEAALQALQRELRRNPVAGLPEAPAAPPSEFSVGQLTSRDVIQQFNAQADIRAMVVHYGGRRASATLYHCPCGQHGNGDKTPSLGISPARNPRYGAWMLKGFAPSCAFHTATDAFGLYCRMEGLSAKEAVKQLSQQFGADQAAPGPQSRTTNDTEAYRRRPVNPPAAPPEPAADLSARLRQAAWLRLAQDMTLPPAARRLMGTLLTEMEAHSSMWCRPSVPALMSITGYSRRSVQTALRRLEQAHYIQTDFAGNAGHGGDETNVYQLWTSGGNSSTAPAESPAEAEGGRNSAAPKVKLDSSSQLTTRSLKPGRGGNRTQATETPVQTDRSSPPSALTQGTPPKAASLPAPQPDNHDSVQTGQPAGTPRSGKKAQTTAAQPAEGATFTPVAEPITRRWPASPDRSQRWLYELGNDLDTLRQAETTARREAKYHFVQRQPTAGRRRMWEAGQIRDRIALLERLPQRPTTPRPAAQLSLEQAANVQRLRKLGIYPANAERYGRLPTSAIDQADALARSIGGDQARLVTSFLKRHALEGWRIPQPFGADSGLLDEQRFTSNGAFAAHFIRDEGNVAAEWAAWAARLETEA